MCVGGFTPVDHSDNAKQRRGSMGYFCCIHSRGFPQQLALLVALVAVWGLEAYGATATGRLQGCHFPSIVMPGIATRSLALHSPGFPTPGVGEAEELVPETYRSWQGDTYGMFGFEGQYVRVLVQTNDFPLLGKERMNELVDRCDLLYSNMRDLLGWEPGGEGRLSIALAVDTCGSGCGVVGGKGIEVEVDFQAYGPERIDGGYGAVWSILIHEMAHNFDPVSGPIFYTSDTAHAWTSFLNFYVMVADGNGSLEHFPPFHRPAEILDAMVGHFFDPYVEDATATWDSCIEGGDCTFPSPESSGPAKQRGAQGGMLLKFAQQAGPAATRRMLRHLVDQVMADPGSWVQRPAPEKADLLAQAMSVATDGNIGPAFDRWKWKLSSEKRAELAAAFPSLPGFAIDRDGDGFSTLEGDCDDGDSFVLPRPVVPWPGLASGCVETPDLPRVIEDGDFPGFEGTPLEISVPVSVSGAGQVDGDVDRFTFHLARETRLLFTLISTNTWGGYCFFDHTREYAVLGRAGHVGRFTVTLGPGPVGIRMEPFDGQGVGDYRLLIEPLEAQPLPTWVEPVGACGAFAELPELVETSEFPYLREDAVPLRIPCEIVGATCSIDDEDWFSLRLDEPTALRISILSDEGFAGWVFCEPNLGMAHTLVGQRGGTIVSFPAGEAHFRVVSEVGKAGRYRVVIRRESEDFLRPPPPPEAMTDGSWILRTGPLRGVPAAPNLMARFWLAGRGWIGAAGLNGGEASMRISLPREADPYSLAYRFQLHSDGEPVAPMTPRRVFPGRQRRLPVSVAGDGIVPSTTPGRYDATFRVTRGEAAMEGSGEIRLDGRPVQSFESLPLRFTLPALASGVHSVSLRVRPTSPDALESSPFPFAVFRTAELNAKEFAPSGRPPADLRTLHRVQDLSLAAVPDPGDLALFEDLSHFRADAAGPTSARALLQPARLRSVSVPGPTPTLRMELSPENRVRVRGVTFGRLAVLQHSSDLKTWVDVPYSRNTASDRVIDVDLPAPQTAGYFRLVTR